MAVRNRRGAESASEEIENLSETVEQNGRRAIETSERAGMSTLAAFDAFNGPIAKVMDQNRMMFEKMMHAMQEESLKFVNRRLEHTSRALESSRECQGVSGLVAVQQEFLMEMARDYADQTRRFADLVRELTEDGSSSMTEATTGMGESMRRAARRAEMQTEAAE